MWLSSTVTKGAESGARFLFRSVQARMQRKNGEKSSCFRIRLGRKVMDGEERTARK